MATYFGHQPAYKRPRFAGPGYGPPAPYPFQREGPARQDLREPGPSRNPKFLEQRHGRTDYQQFRQQRGSVPQIRPPHFSMSEEMYAYQQKRAMIHLGMRLARLNPTMRVLSYAFDVANMLDWNNPWGKTHPGEAGYDMTGWTLCCKIGEGKGGYVKIYGGASEVPIGQPPPSYVPQPCTSGLRCGTTFQVPDGEIGQDITGFNPLPNPRPGRYYYAADHVYFGAIYSGVYRMTYEEKWGRARTRLNNEVEPDTTLKWVEKPGVVQPLPHVTPPMPVFQETAIDPYRDPRAPLINLPYILPYQRPAITIDLGARPGGRNPPPHVPPKIDVHEQLPPGPGVRERKHRMPAGKLGGLIAGLYDKTTEAKDIIDILFDNLPKHKQCKGAKDLSSKSYCVWKNLDHLDVGNAIEDLLWNHLEDKAWGKFFSYGKKSPFGTQLPGGTKPQVQLSQRT